MKSRMEKDLKIILAVAAAAVIIMAFTLWATPTPYSSHMWEPRGGGRLHNGMMRGDLEVYYTAKTAISTVNSVLLLGLLAIYVDIYRKTESEFTLGLIIFCVALLLYAVTSNPWVHQLLGYRGSGLGPFAMLPDTFTLVASVVLLYLSQK